MRRSVERRVRDWAANACEYCRMPAAVYDAEFQMDHVIARQHRGRSLLSNLAFARLRCNADKGPNLAGIDPITGRMAPLFNPRRQRWGRHFRWRRPLVVGLTATGRATVLMLAMNDPGAVRVRVELIRERSFPPKT